MAPLNPKWLVGRTIVAVRLNPFKRGPGYAGGSRATNPVLYLDNGATVTFAAQEAEDRYGVAATYHPPYRRKPRRES